MPGAPPPLPIPPPVVRIISLAGSPRLAHMRASWESRFPDVRVFCAVRGRDLADDDPRISASMFRRLRVRAFKSPFSIGVNAILMQNKAQLGCALSHIGLWTEVVRTNQPAIVVEDDVVLDPTVSRSQILRECTSDFVALLHNTFSWRSPRLTANATRFWGMQAYFITPAAARILVDRALPCDMHIDRYVATMAVRVGADWRLAKLPFREIGASTLDHATTRQIRSLGAVVMLVLVVVAAAMGVGYGRRARA